MDPWVTVGYFLTIGGCIVGIIRLSERGKVTGSVLLGATIVILTIVVLTVWKAEIPDGVLPVLSGALGYIFGTLPSKTQNSPNESGGAGKTKSQG